MPERRLLNAVVRDLMSTDPVVAAPEEELSDVLSKMRKHEIHEVPVVKDGELVGMVSQATILRRRKLPLNTRVDSLLVRPPRVEPDHPIPAIAESMVASDYRGLPVVEDDRLVGMISRSDVVRAAAVSDEFAELSVGDLMTPDPQTVQERDPLQRAREVMRALDERAVPVVDEEGALTGVVGLRDLVRAQTKGKPEKTTKGDWAGERLSAKIEVRSVMSVPPVTVGPAETGAAVAALMTEHAISSVVVVEDGHPTGIVTQADLLEHLAGLRRREQVLVQISGLDEDDWWTYETLYAIIGRGLRKVSDIEKPKVFSVHVATYKERGDRSKYSMRCRLFTENGLRTFRDHAWDPAEAMHKVMDQMERRIKEDKEMKVYHKKSRRRERP